jgi:CBS domain-containing protein
LRQQRNTPYLFSQSLHKAPDLDTLVRIAQELPQQIRAFAHNARDAATAGRLVAAVTDTLTQRLIELYMAEHEPPQVPWAWLAFGSQGRCDQTLYSDQDNGLLLDDHITPSDRDWFAGLARWVCDGLAACGIPYCPGDIMASNPKWRLTQSEWERRFRDWVDAPTPEGVMHSMIFFDSRCVAGHQALYNRHRQQIAQLGQESQFLAQIGGIVVRIPVPLGLFDRFRTQRKDGAESIDIKKLGIAVANDLVRLQALQAGLTEAPTLARLQALSGRRGQAQEDLDNLTEAWRVLTDIRLRWQLSDMARVSAPNHIQPDRLSTLERRQLKAAFRILKRSQDAVALRYRLGI